ncbi:hypothetical protein D3C72_1787080 [compost metagenome]
MHRVVGEGHALGIHFNGVAVGAGLQRNAVGQVERLAGRRLRGQVAHLGGRQRHALVAMAAFHGLRQRAGEIEVAGLVARGIRVRDVGGNHRLPLVAQAQRFLLEA